jgi:hypothetical protein
MCTFVGVGGVAVFSVLVIVLVSSVMRATDCG